ncbi:MAG: tyrosine-type recombinase/integrase [Actinomycetota bacterium]|nr:tyrosine-type recombinase/integrase [Actinomycetota bacterium]
MAESSAVILHPTVPALRSGVGRSVLLVALDEVGRDYDRAARAEATWRAYRSDLKDFGQWCEEVGLVALPASEETVARYLVQLADLGRRPATLARRLASISVAHQMAGYASPTRSRLVRDRLSGIRRAVGVTQRQASPAMTPEIRKMVRALPDSLHGRRDRLVILLGFAAALRRSELAGLDVEDIYWVPEGMEVTIRRSKTDQEAEGVVVAVPYGSKLDTCPVRALRAWLDATGLSEGPLIRGISRDMHIPVEHRLLRRISPEGISRIIARAARRADLDPNGIWTGHSLRAGLATSAAKAGVPDRVIMATTRHKSRASLDRYVRAGRRWEQVAAASVGL